MGVGNYVTGSERCSGIVEEPCHRFTDGRGRRQNDDADTRTDDRILDRRRSFIIFDEPSYQFHPIQSR